MLGLVVAMLIGSGTRPQDADEPARAMLLYAEHLVATAPPKRQMAFELGADSAPGATARLAATLRRAGMTVRPHRLGIPTDTIVAYFSNVVLDSATSGGRFYGFGVIRQECVDGRVRKQQYAVHLRCHSVVCTDLEVTPIEFAPNGPTGNKLCA